MDAEVAIKANRVHRIRRRKEEDLIHLGHVRREVADVAADRLLWGPLGNSKAFEGTQKKLSETTSCRKPRNNRRYVSSRKGMEKAVFEVTKKATVARISSKDMLLVNSFPRVIKLCRTVLRHMLETVFTSVIVLLPIKIASTIFSWQMKSFFLQTGQSSAGNMKEPLLLPSLWIFLWREVLGFLGLPGASWRAQDATTEGK